MELHSDYEVQCEKYLLGELSEADSQQVEEAYFADDRLFERFLAVKEDLFDAYARGLLTGNKRKHFEKQFLGSKSRREEIEDADQLIRVTTASPQDRAAQRANPPTYERYSIWNWLVGRSVLIPATALAILLSIAFGSWILLRDRPNRTEKDNKQANQNISANPVEENSPGERTATVKATPQVLPSERGAVEHASGTDSGAHKVAPERSSRASSTAQEKVAARTSAEETVALVVEPHSSRSINPAPMASPPAMPSGITVAPQTYYVAPRLLLNSNVRFVQLSLVYRHPVEGPVDASISDMGGREVVSVRDLEVQSDETKSVVTFKFLASRLKRNDHIARLSTRTKDGTSETIAEYYFTVTRKAPTLSGPPKQ